MGVGLKKGDRKREPGQTGNFVFLSHSHQDLNEVRDVRDELEAHGHFPLMFFLKCLDDNSEVDELIKREIEARDWFLICDSPRSRESRWVQTELEHIESFPNKYFSRVELGQDANTRRMQIKEFSKRMTVYIAYVRDDSATARTIAGRLRTHGYRVFPNERQMAAGEDWGATTELQLTTAAVNGFVLPILSEKSVRIGSPLKDELLAALRAKAPGHGNIIPIRTEECTPPLPIYRIQYMDWSSGDPKENLENLVHLLKTAQLG